MVFQSAITWEDSTLRHHFFGSASPWQHRRLNSFEVWEKAFITCDWEGGSGRGPPADASIGTWKELLSLSLAVTKP